MKTDNKLRQDVLDELEWDPSLNATRVSVDARAGIVTLDGYVDTFVEKWSAERAVERVPGVTALVVELEVRLPGMAQQSDFDIAWAADNILQWSSNLAGSPVHVLVENGWITLSGEVEYVWQRKVAVTALQHLAGIRGVHDHITLKPQVCSADVLVSINAALKRRGIDSHVVASVASNGTDVTLSGVLDTWSDRNLARHAAWNTAGVQRVVDYMTVGR